MEDDARFRTDTEKIIFKGGYSMSNEEIDKRIDSIKQNFERVVEALGDIDAEREQDKKDFNKRITQLEYAYARILEKQNGGA